jgi:hypothetical protein
MCLLDGGTHYHREAHRILQKNIQGNGLFIRELKYEVVMLPRWLVSTPIQLYAHPATPESTPLGVDYASLMHALGVWLRCMPPPQNHT